MTDNVIINSTVNEVSSEPSNNVISPSQTINEVTIVSEENSINVSSNINEIVVADVGIQGPPGPQGVTGTTGAKGDKGDTGATGGIGPLAFVFEQQSNSASWNVVHNLGYYPNVSIKEYGNKTVEGEVVYINANSLTILFSVAISGYAYLS